MTTERELDLEYLAGLRAHLFNLREAVIAFSAVQQRTDAERAESWKAVRSALDISFNLAAYATPGGTPEQRERWLNPKARR